MEGRSEEVTYRLEDYAYELPQELIAQHPCAGRDASRLLIMDRNTGRTVHGMFADVRGYLKPGDVLVLNDTRVVPARVRGTKESGGRVELLVMDPYKSPELGRREGYLCLVISSMRTAAGSPILLPDGSRASVLDAPENGRAMVLFPDAVPFLELLDRIGDIPLPPYIHREGSAAGDAEDYQTVYAARPGAVAAPTAGLHFSRGLLKDLECCGVEMLAVTLHVGYGTFAPIRETDIRKHRMHEEYVEISPETVERIVKAKGEGRRIVAVGTTVVRTLEWASCETGLLQARRGACKHYIFPGYRFNVVDAMITNFHLPGSTLLLLVSAFAGREAILAAYREAVDERYRFFSYGDAMLIL
ncbi:MAG: tRNA preQ1(34) S-adenosylmethionine ribosyltransferase-isomerase QueA [Syntrophobacteraceae bacterium]